MKPISETAPKIRVLFAILSTDIHTRGSIIVADALKNAGMDVIYLGFRQTVQMVIDAVETEDPDVICLSTHEGFHTQLFPKLVNEMKLRNLNIPIVAGGNIQGKEITLLESLGITGNFGSGTSLNEIVEHIRQVSTIS